MDNVPADKVKEIEPLIQSRGATVLYESHYSPDFNPIENWWSQLKAVLRSFSPTSAWYSATALDLINPHHLKTGLPTVVTVPHKPGIRCIINRV